MNSIDPGRLLNDLHRGATSRNRSFELFRDPRARRVSRGYRRLRSLFVELARPGMLVEAHWSADHGALTVACRHPGLRYQRRVELAPWEAAFFLEHVGSSRVVPVGSTPG